MALVHRSAFDTDLMHEKEERRVWAGSSGPQKRDMRVLRQQQKQLQEELIYTTLRLAVCPATYDNVCHVHHSLV